MRANLVWTCLVLSLGGCGSVDNARIDVGGDISLALEEQADRRDNVLVEAPSRSIEGVSREGWAPVTIVLAPDGTQHWPRLSKNGPRYFDHHRRLTGAHPTAASALEIEPDTDGALGEFLAGPIQPAWDVVLAIPRMIGAVHRGEPVASPAYSYQRGAPLSGAPVLAPAISPIDDAPVSDDP